MTFVKRLALASLLVTSVAMAQIDGGTARPSPRQSPKPSKSIGSAKEDDEPDTVAPAMRAPAPVDGDLGLLRALLFAFEPAPTEIRVIAVEDLGLLGDTRALNALAQLVMDANPLVQQAAVRAIASIQHPRAEAILANIVRHPAIGEKVKLSAIDALLFQNSTSSLQFLDQLTKWRGVHPALQQQARRAVSELPPGRAASVTPGGRVDL